MENGNGSCRFLRSCGSFLGTCARAVHQCRATGLLSLFGLLNGIISPESSLLAWDKTAYPFTEWNANQDLYSAMKNSVNWYFEEFACSPPKTCRFMAKPERDA